MLFEDHCSNDKLVCEVNCGLKQVCLLSQVLFNIYINDLVDKLKKAGVGIEY